MSVEKIAQRYREARKTADFHYERVVVDLAVTISEIMDADGVTRTELAQRLGKSKAWVTKLLRGEQNMTLKTIVTVLWELGYNADVSVRAAEASQYEATQPATYLFVHPRLDPLGQWKSGRSLQHWLIAASEARTHSFLASDRWELGELNRDFPSDVLGRTLCSNTGDGEGRVRIC